MRRFKAHLILLLLVAVTLLARYMVPVNAQFSDTEAVRCEMSAGTWQAGPAVKIYGLCPDWGLAGACRWPVFIYGKGFRGSVVARLIRGEHEIRAVKAWVLSSGMVYAIFDLREASAGAYDVRLDFHDGRAAVLYGGFTVVRWEGCVTMNGDMSGAGSPAGRALPGCSGEGSAGWEKGVDAANPFFLRIAPKGTLKVGISKAYAVAPGLLLEGEIMRDGRGGVSVRFDLRDVPRVACDVVLLTPEDWPLLLEGFITPADVASVAPLPAPVPQAQPAPPSDDKPPEATVSPAEPGEEPEEVRPDAPPGESEGMQEGKQPAPGSREEVSSNMEARPPAPEPAAGSSR